MFKREDLDFQGFFGGLRQRAAPDYAKGCPDPLHLKSMVTLSRIPESKNLALKCAKQTEGQSIETRRAWEVQAKAQGIVDARGDRDDIISRDTRCCGEGRMRKEKAMKRDALLIYRDGTERHVKLPESLSPIPDPLPTHILMSAAGEVLAYMFRGSDFGLPIDETDSVMARDPESPDECPVYWET